MLLPSWLWLPLAAASRFENLTPTSRTVLLPASADWLKAQEERLVGKYVTDLSVGVGKGCSLYKRLKGYSLQTRVGSFIIG